MEYCSIRGNYDIDIETYLKSPSDPPDIEET